MADYWFNSEAGIRAHYASQKADEKERHKNVMRRIREDEAATIKALKESN